MPSLQGWLLMRAQWLMRDVSVSRLFWWRSPVRPIMLKNYDALTAKAASTEICRLDWGFYSGDSFNWPISLQRWASSRPQTSIERIMGRKDMPVSVREYSARTWTSANTSLVTSPIRSISLSYCWRTRLVAPGMKHWNSEGRLTPGSCSLYDSASTCCRP